MKVFSEAKKFVTVDQSVIDDAVSFLIGTQQNDGSFAKVGRVN